MQVFLYLKLINSFCLQVFFTKSSFNDERSTDAFFIRQKVYFSYEHYSMFIMMLEGKFLQCSYLELFFIANVDTETICCCGFLFRVRKASPTPDHLSVKSESSMIQPVHFSQGEQQKYTRSYFQILNPGEYCKGNLDGVRHRVTSVLQNWNPAVSVSRRFLTLMQMVAGIGQTSGSGRWDHSDFSRIGKHFYKSGQDCLRFLQQRTGKCLAGLKLCFTATVLLTLGYRIKKNLIFSCRRSTSPSQVSLKSAGSMIQPVHFSSGKRSISAFNSI